MATLNINILNPVINLISKYRETSNSCMSVFEFTIQSSPYAEIKVDLTKTQDVEEDYDFAQVDLGTGTYTNYTSGETFTLNLSGKAKFRVIVGNAVYHGEPTRLQTADGDYCNITQIKVTDLTNNKESQKQLRRCNSDARCADLEPPQAQDDYYTILIGTASNLNVTSNDSAGSNYGTLQVSLESQPSHGAAINIGNGLIRYENDGTGTEDSFTYRVVNNLGETSNLATVHITIDSGQQEIEPTTDIVIAYDTSGSMSTIIPHLEDMRNHNLKQRLLQYYNNDEALYNQRVDFYPFSSERFLRALVDRLNEEGNTIVIIVQNEAENQGYYSGWEFNPNDPRNSNYNTDIKKLNTDLDKYEYDFNATILQIGDVDEGINPFTLFLESIKEGKGNYSGSFGLSQRDNISVTYDISPTGTAQDYTDEVIGALEELGFNI